MSDKAGSLFRQPGGSPAGVAAFALLFSVSLAITPWWLIEGWQTAVFRPAYGLTVAALLLLRRRQWPAILATAAALGAAFAVLTQNNTQQLITLALAEPLEATVVALLVRRLDRNALDLASMRSVAISVCAFLLLPLVFALATSLAMAVATATGPAWQTSAMGRWYSGSLSLLLVVPVAMAWFRAPSFSPHIALSRFEWTAAVTLPAALLLVLGASNLHGGAALSGLVVVALLLLWGALRLQSRLTTTATLLVCTLAALYVAHTSVQPAVAAASLISGSAALPFVLICVSIALLLVSAALLGNAKKLARAQHLLHIAASVAERLELQSAATIEQGLQTVLRQTAVCLDAAGAALYTRGADSALYRRAYAWRTPHCTLPDAFLASQLQNARTRHENGVVKTIITDQQSQLAGRDQQASANLAMTVLVGDDSETTLAVGWASGTSTMRHDAADLLRLIRPACAMAMKRCQEQSAHQQAEDRCLQIMASVPDAIAVVTPDGTLVAVNPGFEKLTGFRGDEVLGRSYAELQIMDWPIEAAATADLRDQESQAGGFRQALRRKSGSSTQVELHTTQASIGGEAHVVVLAREATPGANKQRQQRDLEKQLNQAQRMEAIGQLTQGVAHDFNNILGSILGYCSLARMHKLSREDDKLQEYLSEIEIAGKRATLLIQQMLTFSRRGRTNPAQVDVNEMLGRVLNLLPSLLPAGIEARLNVSQELPRLVVDNAQFEQAIISLAVNARDAIIGNGTITLGSRRFRRSDATCNSCRRPMSGEAIEIYVADSGTGIAPELMDRLFEPFFTTKEVGRGTGLGLSGVHGFVHNHDGHVLISSRIGAGSEFSMVLPVEPAKVIASAAQEAPGRPSAESSRHILFVDDQQSLASLMKQVLETREFKVSAFTNSHMAWDRFAAEPAAFDAVITDQFMPGMDGIELARRVSTTRPDIPVVLCTGAQSAITETEMAAAGIGRVFRKPLRVLDFANAIEELLAETRE